MKKLLPALVALLAVGFLSATLLMSEAGAPAATGGDGVLAIVTAKGARHVFDVEVVRTPEDQMRGLMFRPSMPETHGMLFPFAQSQPMAFWMKNTRIPLDIVFIDAGGKIINIGQGVPFSLAPVPSAAPAKAVLEINSGTCARLGIAAGDVVEHPFFR
jgi:uncharacterized protein